MKSILSRRGFSIDKRGTPADVLKKHREQLTITPHVEREEYAHLSQPIKIYQETEQRLYVPRFYAAANIGPPETDKLTTLTFDRCENLTFQGKMLPAQLPVVEAAKRALDTSGGGVISINCGGG